MSLNKVMLIGNVGKEPEVRYIDNGVATATLSLATSTPGYTLPNGTQVPERSVVETFSRSRGKVCTLGRQTLYRRTIAYA